MPECIVWPISMAPTVVWRVSKETQMTGDITHVIQTQVPKYAWNTTMDQSARQNVYHGTTTRDITTVVTRAGKYVILVGFEHLAPIVYFSLGAYLVPI